MIVMPGQAMAACDGIHSADCLGRSDRFPGIFSPFWEPLGIHGFPKYTFSCYEVLQNTPSDAMGKYRKYCGKHMKIHEKYMKNT